MQTYYRGEVNIDQKTPEDQTFKKYEYPYIFGSRVNRGDEELAKSKFPQMHGIVGYESDASRCYSQQSSVVSQWEDRILSGDEEVGPEGSGKNHSTELETSKDERFNFHDMSKAIPERQPNLSPSHHKAAGKADPVDKVFHFSDTTLEPGESPFLNEVVNDAKRNEKGSPKVRKNVVQLEAINGHQNHRFQEFMKPSTWAVAAGGVKSTNVSPDVDDPNTNDQTFYPMKLSEEVIDPNLCDKLLETSDKIEVFEGFREEPEEQFKKCSNNGWTENNKFVVRSDEVNETNSLVNSCNNETEERTNHNVQNGESYFADEINNDDFSFDPAIKVINNTNAFTEERKYEEKLEFSPDKSTELFLRSLVTDNEENNQKSVGPIWILPPDEGQKKKSKKKKKRV